MPLDRSEEDFGWLLGRMDSHRLVFLIQLPDVAGVGRRPLLWLLSFNPSIEAGFALPQEVGVGEDGASLYPNDGLVHQEASRSPGLLDQDPALVSVPLVNRSVGLEVRQTHCEEFAEELD